MAMRGWSQVVNGRISLLYFTRASWLGLKAGSLVALVVDHLDRFVFNHLQSGLSQECSDDCVEW